MSGQPTHPGWIWVTGWSKDTGRGTVSELVNNERPAFTSWLDLGNRVVKTQVLVQLVR